MAKKNLSLLKGSFTVIILALLIYVTIFFFFPDVSLKYFGDAFDKEKALENSIVALVYNVDYMSEEEKAVFEDYLTSRDGKEMLKSISSAASTGVETTKELVDSPEFQRLSSAVKDVLSPESLSRLMEEAAESAENLYSWYKK